MKHALHSLIWVAHLAFAPLAAANLACEFHLASGDAPRIIPAQATSMRGTRQEKPILVVLDGVSSGNLLAPEAQKMGFFVVHIHTEGKPNKNFASSFTGEGIDRDVAHDGDLDKTVRLVSELGEVVAVVPGYEGAVSATPSFQAAFQSRFPRIINHGYHPEYRNKAILNQVLKAKAKTHGLRLARQTEAVTTEQAVQWAKEQGLFDEEWRAGGEPVVVIKPPESSATEGVIFCHTLEELREKFGQLVGTINKYGLANKSIVVMEYLPGPEFVVDLVRGKDPHTGRIHTKVTDLWRYYKYKRQGYATVYDYDMLLDPYGPIQDQIVDYITRICDAMGYDVGWVHAEVILTPTGPVLIDFGARMVGSGVPRIVKAATGHSQVDAGILAYTNFEEFTKLPDRYRKEKHATVINLTAREAGGRLSFDPLPRLKDLRSLSHFGFSFNAGDEVPLPKSLSDAYAQIELVHEDAGILEQERDLVRRFPWVIYPR